MREFVRGDFERLDSNGLTCGLGKVDVNLVLENSVSYTFEFDGEIIAIMSYLEYDDKCLTGFLLCSKKMNSKYGLIIRKAIKDVIIKTKAIRLETCSFDTPVLNSWHEFLGFTCEGIRRKYAQGKDAKMWSIVNGN